MARDGLEGGIETIRTDNMGWRPLPSPAEKGEGSGCG